MAISRFNLSFLRSLTARSIVPATSSGETDSRLSRRSFLALSGASIALKAVPPFLRGDGFALQRDGARIHVLVGDERRWTIDPAMFGERAHVAVTHADEEIIIALRQATFPATCVPADFICRLNKHGGIWMLRLSMECGIAVSSALLSWLNRNSTATGSWETLHFAPFDELSVVFASAPDVRFNPDWNFSVSSPCRLTLRGLRQALPAAGFNFLLNSTTTLAGNSVDRSTSIVVPRGGERWEIDLSRQSDVGWSLDHAKDQSIFDELNVEASVSNGQILRSALFTQSPSNQTALEFQPGGRLCNDCGEPFAFPLRNARLAFGLEDEHVSSLIADLSEERVWAHSIGASYLLGASADAPNFELHDSPGASGMPQFSPGICEICFPHDHVCMDLKFRIPQTAIGWLQLTHDDYDKPYIDLKKDDCLYIERPADLLSLRFYFENMRLVTGPDPRIVHMGKKDQPARIKVVFPPQNLAEQAFFITKETGITTPDVPIGNVELQDFYYPNTPTKTVNQLKQVYDPDYPTPPPPNEIDRPAVKLSGITRLVFGLPSPNYEIPCNIEALLKWKDWTPIVVPVAQSVVNTGAPDKPPDLNNLPEIIDPTDQFTSVEMPFRLSLSPSELGRWAHSPKPVESPEKIVELWHTRLGVKAANPKKGGKDDHSVRIDEVNAKDRVVRAIWSGDYVPIPLGDPGSCSIATPQLFPDHPTNQLPFRMSLDERDRCELVHLTSNYAITQQKYFCTNSHISPPIPKDLLYPAPVQINRMMLTSMGGYLDAFGQWNPCKVDINNQLTVQMWNHRATLGRDHYVKVVYKGYLVPFGLRASLVKVTQRVFKKNSAANWIAPLHQHMYIVVKSERKQCPVMGQPFSGRAFPFSYVEPVTLTTPFLNDPTTQHWPKDCSKQQSQSLFWPMVPASAPSVCSDPPGVPFYFRLRFTDVTGIHAAEASMPLVFVGSDVAQTDGFAANPNCHDAVRLYNSGSIVPQPQSDDPYISAIFSGQKFSYAASTQSGDTDFETTSIAWRAMALTASVSGSLVNVKSGAIITFKETVSGTQYVLVADSSGKYSVAIDSGVYTITVTTPVAPNPIITTSPALQFPGNQQYTVDLTLAADFKSFNPPPNPVQTSKNPGPIDLYHYDLPYFYPAIDYARITSTSIKRITGNSIPTKFNFAPTYLSDGFNAKTNPGDVFLQKNTDDTLTLSFGASGNVDKAGGLASPDTMVVGFSRKAGAVGGTAQTDPATGKQTVTTSVSTFSSGKFDPADFFGGLASAKLLGAVKLSDIIAAVSPGLVSNLLKAPQMLEQALYTGETTVQSFLDTAFSAIQYFQDVPNNPLAVPLASAAQQFFAAYDALADTSAGDVLQRGLLEAQAIDRIADYASAAQVAVQNPLSLVEDAIIQALADAIQQAIGNLSQTVIDQLNQLADQLSDALDQQIQNLVAALDALQKALAPKIVDAITGVQQALSVLAPDLNNLVQLSGQIQTLSGNITSIGASIKTFTAQPSQLQELAQIGGTLSDLTANLQQIYQKAGFLGIVISKATAGPPPPVLTAAINQAQTNLNNLWLNIDYAAAASDLATLQENCVKLASAYDQTRSEGQQILQNIRQLQNSVAKATTYKKAATGDAKSLYRQLQLLQKMQAHILRALAALQGLAQETLPAGASAVVQQAATDIQKAVPDLADKLTVSKLLIDAAGAGTAIEQQIAAVTGDPNASKPLQASSADLKQQLLTLRTQIARDPLNVALKLAQYNLSIDYQRPVAAALSYIAYLEGQTIAEFDDFVSFLQPIEKLALQLQATLCQVQTLWNTFKTVVGNIPGPNNTSIGSIILSIFGSEISAIDSAFGNLCDPAQIAPSQFLQNAQQLVAAFVALETDVRSKIPSLSTIEAALTDAIKQEVEDLLASVLGGPIPTSINLSYTWRPDIQSFEPVFILQPDASFEVTAQAQAALNSQLNGVSASFDIDAKLTNFSIVLIGEQPFITLYIDSLTFTSKNGSKPDCRLKLNRVGFGAAMQFVEDLAQALDPSQGPFIELAADSIRAGFRFAIESMTVGAFNLMQLAIEVAVALPFDGTPVRCEFNLSDQQQPFLLSCGIYGGGGFLQLQLGLDGVQLLQGAFEFGVCAAISIGPLQGDGFVVAGIYFRITGNDSEVCGFVHAHGHMDIFGIISMDVDLYVAICYLKPSVQGIATFSVSVSIAFFSETFSMQAQYSFGGSDSSTSQKLLMDARRADKRTKNKSGVLCPGPWQTKDLFIDPTVWKNYFNSFA